MRNVRKRKSDQVRVGDLYLYVYDCTVLHIEVLAKHDSEWWVVNHIYPNEKGPFDPEYNPIARMQDSELRTYELIRRGGHLKLVAAS